MPRFVGHDELHVKDVAAKKNWVRKFPSAILFVLLAAARGFRINRTLLLTLVPDIAPLDFIEAPSIVDSARVHSRTEERPP